MTWLGGNGSWLDPTKWSGGVVLNNGADTFDVVIDGDQSALSNVNLNVSPPAQYTVSSLRIASGDLLSIKPTIVNVSGPPTVDGDFWVIGGELVVGSSQTLGGNGTLWLDEDWTSFRIPQVRASSQALTIGSGFTVHTGPTA